MMRKTVAITLVVLVTITLGVGAADSGDKLLAAAKKGDIEVVKALLDKGADVNAKNTYGATALSYAAEKGHSKVVELLLKHKADPNVEDTFYRATPLSWALSRDHTETARALIEAGAKVSDETMLAVAAAGNAEIVRVIISKTKPSKVALTKALAATPAKHTAVVDLLTKAGAKPPVKTDGVAKPELDVYVGTYRSDAAAELKIVTEEGKLGIKVEIGPVIRLNKADKATFKSEDDKVTVTFNRQGDKIQGLTVKVGEKESVFRRVDAAKELAPGTTMVEDRGGTVKTPLNWPSFRGPNASGIADGQFPPVVWDVEKKINLRWKTPIPGLGHSCPVVWEQHVYLTTAVSGDGKAEFRPGLYGDVDSVTETSEHTWRVYCLDRKTGKILWEQTAWKGVPKVKRHTKGSHANPTPATDGTHVVVSFGSEGLYCYGRDGKLLWSKNLGVLNSSWFYDADYQWGFGSSPVIYKDLVIVQCDVGKDSFLAAYRIGDGKELWRKAREEIPSWGTPTVVEGPKRVELVTNATKFARGYDPLTGEELWKLARHSEITVPTPIFGEGLIFITSGYRPVQPIYAIRPGAAGDISLKDSKTANDAIAWSLDKGGPYMPTPIVYRGHLYICSNTGIVTCYDAKTGKQVYKDRLGGRGGYTASPVAADGRIYFPSEESGVRVIKAGAKFELLAINPLGEACMATPAISDGMMFVRTQHHLLGLGRKE